MSDLGIRARKALYLLYLFFTIKTAAVRQVKKIASFNLKLSSHTRHSEKILLVGNG
jgi:hypothetical protein